LSSSQHPVTARTATADGEAVIGVDEIAQDELSAQLVRDGEGQAGGAPDHPQRLLGGHGEPEGEQQSQGRILAVEPAQEQPLDRDADERHQHRRHCHRPEEAEALLDLVGEVGAHRIEGAVGEVDHTPEAEDQRQAERQYDIQRAHQ
jgi:hypothetical protein